MSRISKDIQFDLNDFAKNAKARARESFGKLNDLNPKNHRDQYHTFKIPVVCDGESHDVVVVFRSNRNNAPLVTCRAYHYDRVEDGEFDIAIHALSGEEPKCQRVAHSVLKYIKEKAGEMGEYGTHTPEKIAKKAFAKSKSVGGYEDNELAHSIFKSILARITSVKQDRDQQRKSSRRAYKEFDQVEPNALRNLAKQIVRLNPYRMQSFVWQEREILIDGAHDTYRPTNHALASCCDKLERREARHYKIHWETQKHHKLFCEELAVKYLSGYMGRVLYGMQEDKPQISDDEEYHRSYRSDTDTLLDGWGAFQTLVNKKGLTQVLGEVKKDVKTRVQKWEKRQYPDLPSMFTRKR